MSNRKKVLAISGSTRKGSVNYQYIQAIAAYSPFDIILYEGVDSLPHFNPDLDTEKAPTAVVAFRKQIYNAEGVLICTPEYAMGVPGSLKNAIDWTVSSGEFSKKPVALVTAGLSGLKSHAALLNTLQVIEAKIAKGPEVVISFAKTKIDINNVITDTKTAESLERLIAALDACMQEPNITQDL